MAAVFREGVRARHNPLMRRVFADRLEAQKRSTSQWPHERARPIGASSAHVLRIDSACASRMAVVLCHLASVAAPAARPLISACRLDGFLPILEAFQRGPQTCCEECVGLAFRVRQTDLHDRCFPSTHRIPQSPALAYDPPAALSRISQLAFAALVQK